jgi:hypothetical protein
MSPGRGTDQVINRDVGPGRIKLLGRGQIGSPGGETDRYSGIGQIGSMGEEKKNSRVL